MTLLALLWIWHAEASPVLRKDRLHGEEVDASGWTAALHIADNRHDSMSGVSLESLVLDTPSSQNYNLSRKKKSYSQWKQDKILAPILNQFKNGFFVESGAYDGETHSNSLYYERKGWTGLLVEPGAKYLQIPGKHRKAWGFHGALSPTRSSMRLHFNDSLTVGAHLDTSSTYLVRAEPLETLLKRIDPNRTSVDFWSLDIEGDEPAVLEATDFSKIKVGVLLIEMNKSRKINKRIKAVMDKNNFHDLGRTVYVNWKSGHEEYLDHVFINPSYLAKHGVEMPANLTGLAKYDPHY